MNTLKIILMVAILSGVACGVSSGIMCAFAEPEYIIKGFFVSWAIVFFFTLTIGWIKDVLLSKEQ